VGDPFRRLLQDKFLPKKEEQIGRAAGSLKTRVPRTWKRGVRGPTRQEKKRRFETKQREPIVAVVENHKNHWNLCLLPFSHSFIYWFWWRFPSFLVQEPKQSGSHFLPGPFIWPQYSTAILMASFLI
jgi:hypothetical protein